ncbi:MAG: hypothetical protein FGM55_09145, partial [Rhodoferax sp.]|nr:hypothetical protein [Rhodoferax sp.]
MTVPFNLDALLKKHGLVMRGSFRPANEDALPRLAGDRVAAMVCMVGVAGSDFWPHFEQSACFRDGLAHPLDRWSRLIGDQLAQHLGGLALYPFDGPPYWPFQRWAERGESVYASPLQLLIHPEFGLWHAYRFALLLPQAASCSDTLPVDAPPRHQESPCLRCANVPCLSACPVHAYDRGGFRLDRCLTWLG